MKNIVLFSRCELVNLYGRISENLSIENNVIHLAFSDIEKKILEEKYRIKNVINFSDEIKKLYLNESFNLEYCKLIDEVIIEQSAGRFNLNSSIQYDRTFQYQSLDFSLLLCQSYYRFWTELIIREKIDFIVHEPTSLFLNQISSLICKKYNAKYITQILVYGKDEFNFITVSGDDCRFDKLLNLKSNSRVNDVDFSKVNNFLAEFRNDFNTFVDSYNKNRSFRTLLLNSLKSILKYIKYSVKLNMKNFSVLDHIDYYHYKEFNLFSTLKNDWGQYFLLEYDSFDESLDYFYYPMHLEPEAVVLYWGDGLYKDQIKLIENIAAQLPPGYFLYVKDHPHAGAYRSVDDYHKLRSIPNIKLLNPSVQGKKVILKSKGVVTINGTSGFEALLLNKQVYVFGNSFYDSCERVKKIKNVRDFRSVLYSNYQSEYEDDEILFRFVNDFLKSTQKGFTDYFIDFVKRVGVDEIKNAEIVSKEFLEYFRHSNKPI